MKYYIVPTSNINLKNFHAIIYLEDNNVMINKGRYSIIRDVTSVYNPSKDPSNDHVFYMPKEPEMLSAIEDATARYNALHTTIDFHTHADDYYKNRYSDLLNAAVFYRCIEQHSNVEFNLERANQCLEWLENSTDFFTAPASSRYHENYESGLVEHSLKVATKSLELMDLLSFKNGNVKLGSVLFTALVHDWCKCGLYESYMKNVKDDKTGKWHQEKAYKRADRRPCALGHGASSMFLAQKWFNITYEEAAAIRYHMGRWQGVVGEEDELEQCNETIPYVHLLQFADQLAITEYAW